MKNTLLSALLALGIGLMPGFGLNFMSGGSTDWSHADQNSSQTAEHTAEMTAPAPQSPTAPKAHVAHNQVTTSVHKSKVASADMSTVK